eukprot:TRINITY_DN80079_c0_g1_i1.p1 TRINITY_DN80079_c0_g1~~TRINITY_DN80079_c0_g1_i1.p1  ORF type:complete len:146 (+),score=32.31 TRINITY_DN80079_c0_g1_i1:41-478(+)
MGGTGSGLCAPDDVPVVSQDESRKLMEGVRSVEYEVSVTAKRAASSGDDCTGRSVIQLLEGSEWTLRSTGAKIGFIKEGHLVAQPGGGSTYASKLSEAGPTAISMPVTAAHDGKRYEYRGDVMLQNGDPCRISWIDGNEWERLWS